MMDCFRTSTGPTCLSEEAPRSTSVGLEDLLDRLVEQMAEAKCQGKSLGVEELLTRHPELPQHSAAVIRLIYEEICLRQEAGQEVASAEVIHRFPQWEKELRALFDCHRF